MNIEEIKKNAPDGATHYKIDEGYVLYYKDDIYALWLRLANHDWCYSRAKNRYNLKPL